jgi:hypothetical protein
MNNTFEILETQRGRELLIHNWNLCTKDFFKTVEVVWRCSNRNLSGAIYIYDCHKS